MPPSLRVLRRLVLAPGVRALGGTPPPPPPPTPPPGASADVLVAGRAINFHFTRTCNYACKFCFHTAKSSHVLSEADCKRVLRVFREAGAVKLNIAGGEPLLPQYHALVGELLRYSKQELGYDSTSIISNGSRLTPQWFAAHSEHLDIMGVSVDSVEPATLYKLGRWPAGGRPPRAGEGPADIGQQRHVRRAAALCREHGVLFKLNTVVTALNAHEDLSPLVNETAPMRWKIFQVLPMGGENTGAAATRGHDVSPLLVTAAQFAEYVARARAGVSDPSVIEAEDNATMQASYILVDELGRLLDTSTGSKTPTAASVLDAGGVEAAARELLASAGRGFHPEAYDRRGAHYPERWSRSRRQPSAAHAPPCAASRSAAPAASTP